MGLYIGIVINKIIFFHSKVMGADIYIKVSTNSPTNRSFILSPLLLGGMWDGREKVFIFMNKLAHLEPLELAAADTTAASVLGFCSQRNGSDLRKS